jgi:pyrroloquinoline quinone (PQQ) biosynthesis protein C
MVMTGPDYLDWLNHELEPLRHQIVNSRFIKAWCAGEVSREGQLEIMKQYYCLARNVEENFALWAVTCPFDDIKAYFYEQLVEEHYHPLILLRFADEWGVDRQVMVEAQPTTEWGAVYYYYQYLATKHPVERVAAQNFASEGTVPLTHGPMAQAVLEHYGGTTESAYYEWFACHVEADGERHSPIARTVIEKYATTPDLQRKATFAAKHTLEMKIKSLESWYQKFVVGLRSTAIV